MAKNKLTKWIIGASSVAAFTGFIGTVQQFDATKQTAAAPIETAVQADTLNSEKDAVKAEWQVAVNDSDDDDYKGEDMDNANTGSLNGGTTNVSQPAPTSRTRAS